MTALHRAEDEYAHGAQEDQHPEFTRSDSPMPRHRDQASARLTQALADGPDGRVRQRAFNLPWLATCVLAEGDPTSGAHLGNQALDAARGLTSPRLLTQLAPSR